MSKYGLEWDNARHREHREKYESKVRIIGLERLIPILRMDAGRLKVAYDTDPYLNTIPLIEWDSMHFWVQRLAFQSGIKVWSLCDTVCTMKHVAIVHVLKAEATEAG